MCMIFSFRFSSSSLSFHFRSPTRNKRTQHFFRKNNKSPRLHISTSSAIKEEIDRLTLRSRRSDMDINTDTSDVKKLIKKIEATEDFYTILNVHKHASTAQIKKEFRIIARVIHPDKCSLPGAEDAFKKLNTAHKCLTNDESRRHYDLTGGEMSEDGNQSPFGAEGADIFAELFRNHGQGGGGSGAFFESSGRGAAGGVKTINLSELFPEWLQKIVNLPGAVPLVLIVGGIFFFKTLAWLLSLSLYIFPVLYLTPKKVRWWLVLLILLLSLIGYI